MIMDEQLMYRERVADEMLREQLESAGAVLVQGPKWCGKTTTARQQAASVLNMDNPKMMREYMTLAESDPEALLDGEVPRLIDEWQLSPQLWDAARYIIDQRNREEMHIQRPNN